MNYEYKSKKYISVSFRALLCLPEFYSIMNGYVRTILEVRLMEKL